MLLTSPQASLRPQWAAFTSGRPSRASQPAGRSSTAAQQQRRQHLHSSRRLPAAPAAAAGAAADAAQLPQTDASLDDELSKRPLELDAAGYFIIKVDQEAQELVADFYTNAINEKGLACDPVTGEVISCKSGATRLPARTWRGRSAKALSIEILERDHGFKPCTHLEHANYLGRELQRAEFALATGAAYVQD